MPLESGDRMSKNRLKELRRKHRVTQAQLAKDLCVAQNTVSNWENNRRDIDNQTLLDLSRYFKVSIDYLLSNSNDPHPPDLSVYEESDALQAAVQALQRNADLIAIINTLAQIPRSYLIPIDQIIRNIQLITVQKEK